MEAAAETAPPTEVTAGAQREPTQAVTAVAATYIPTEEDIEAEAKWQKAKRAAQWSGLAQASNAWDSKAWHRSQWWKKQQGPQWQRKSEENRATPAWEDVRQRQQAPDVAVVPKAPGCATVRPPPIDAMLRRVAAQAKARQLAEAKARPRQARGTVAQVPRDVPASLAEAAHGAGRVGEDADAVAQAVEAPAPEGVAAAPPVFAPPTGKVGSTKVEAQVDISEESNASDSGAAAGVAEAKVPSPDRASSVQAESKATAEFTTAPTGSSAVTEETVGAAAATEAAETAAGAAVATAWSNQAAMDGASVQGLSVPQPPRAPSIITIPASSTDFVEVKGPLVAADGAETAQPLQVEAATANARADKEAAVPVSAATFAEAVTAQAADAARGPAATTTCSVGTSTEEDAAEERSRMQHYCGAEQDGTLM